MSLIFHISSLLPSIHVLIIHLLQILFTPASASLHSTLEQLNASPENQTGDSIALEKHNQIDETLIPAKYEQEDMHHQNQTNLHPMKARSKLGIVKPELYLIEKKPQATETTSHLLEKP